MIGFLKQLLPFKNKTQEKESEKKDEKEIKFSEVQIPFDPINANDFLPFFDKKCAQMNSPGITKKELLEIVYLLKSKILDEVKDFYRNAQRNGTIVENDYFTSFLYLASEVCFNIATAYGKVFEDNKSYAWIELGLKITPNMDTEGFYNIQHLIDTIAKGNPGIKRIEAQEVFRKAPSTINEKINLLLASIL